VQAHSLTIIQGIGYGHLQSETFAEALKQLWLDALSEVTSKNKTWVESK